MFLNRIPFIRHLDLFLLLNLYFSLNFGQLASMALSVPSGLVQDAFTNPHGILGMNAFSKTIVVFFISGLSSRLMLKHPFVVMTLIFLASNIDLFVIFGLNTLFRLPHEAFSYKPIFTAAILNSMIGIVLFQFADRIRRKKEYV